jgi:3'-5' exoribonuclease 1
LRFIAFDLELTCEQDAQNYPHQIIEIGAVLFEDDELISEFQSFVQPLPPYQVTPFCTTLTGISATQISTAPHIQQAAARFSQFIVASKPQIVISWGQSDYRILSAECVAAGIASTLNGVQYQNVKQAFCKQRKIKHVGLKTALQICGISALGRQHSAVADATNLARLYSFMASVKEQ